MAEIADDPNPNQAGYRKVKGSGTLGKRPVCADCGGEMHTVFGSPRQGIPWRCSACPASDRS